MAPPPAILLLCDDPGLQPRVLASLEREGFRVCGARTVSDALDVLATAQVAAVVADWRGGAGAALCQKIQADPRTARLPVVALGSTSVRTECYQAFEAGVLDYMPHPADARELALRLRAHLRQAVNSP